MSTTQKNNPYDMRQFFTTIFAVLIGGILLFMLPLFIMVGLVVMDSSESVEHNSVMVLDLSDPIVEHDDMSTTAMVRSLISGQERNYSLDLIVDNLAYAATDDDIAALYIKGDYAASDLAVLSELRRAVLDFKKSGKPVFYYATSATTGSLYVASVADSVFVSPLGSVEVRGLRTQKTYFLKLAEKMGLGFDVIKSGRYKSAVEPYFRTDMSPEDREQTERYVNETWRIVRDSIAQGRNIRSSVLDNYVTNLNYVGSATAAAKAKIVDGVAYRDEFINILRNVTGHDKDQPIPTIDVTKYTPNDDNFDLCDNQIAIIYASGEIIDGSYTIDTDNIYGDDLSATLRKARTDKDVKAVVLRVNSPGGSALASDLIWREVKLTSLVKPIVVSMGAYAASGGYYISCAANYIYAVAVTLTGSIGVYGVVPNFESLAAKAEVNFESVASHKNIIEYGTRALSSDAFDAISRSVNHTYQTFVSRVADGRKMSYTDVDKVASGRVWTGVDAVRKGLVDSIGGIDDAIVKAADLAHIADYDVVNYSDTDDSLFGLVKMMSVEARESVGRTLFGEEFADFLKLREMVADPRPAVTAVEALRVEF